jgi:hypothetical protein
MLGIDACSTMLFFFGHSLIYWFIDVFWISVAIGQLNFTCHLSSWGVCKCCHSPLELWKVFWDNVDDKTLFNLLGWWWILLQYDSLTEFLALILVAPHHLFFFLITNLLWTKCASALSHVNRLVRMCSSTWLDSDSCKGDESSQRHETAFQFQLNIWISLYPSHALWVVFFQF